MLVRLAALNAGFLTAGGLTTLPRGPLYRRLIANLRDSFAEAGVGVGWSLHT